MGLALVAAWGGCAHPAASGPESAPQAAAANDAAAVSLRSAGKFQRDYVIAAGDQLDVQVVRSPEVSRAVVVRPDGKLTIPLVGDVAAEGLTFQELTRVLTERLATRVKDPEVYVIGVNVREPVAYVMGDVAAPRPVPLRQARTVAQAVSYCGGFLRSAGVRSVAIIRHDADGHMVAFEVGGIGSSKRDVPIALHQMVLRADDIVFVPESGRSETLRLLNDFVIAPTQAITSVMGVYSTYLQIRYLPLVDDLYREQLHLIREQRVPVGNLPNPP